MTPEKTEIIKKQRIIFLKKEQLAIKERRDQRKLKQNSIQKTRLGFYGKRKIKDKVLLEVKTKSQPPLCPIQMKKKR